MEKNRRKEHTLFLTVLFFLHVCFRLVIEVIRCCFAQTESLELQVRRCSQQWVLRVVFMLSAVSRGSEPKRNGVKAHPDRRMENGVGVSVFWNFFIFYDSIRMNKSNIYFAKKVLPTFMQWYRHYSNGLIAAAPSVKNGCFYIFQCPLHLWVPGNLNTHKNVLSKDLVGSPCRSFLRFSLDCVI